MTAEYKELNDQTYTEVSDIIMRNTGKLQELDDKIKIEWRNTVENFEHIIEDFRDNLTAKLNTLNDKSKQRATKMKDI
jgi:predicted P-loop ATPase